MTRRACERIPSSLVVKFHQDNSVCYGIATDISEKGMCIRSGICLPCDSKFNLQIPLKNSHLEIPVKVRRVEKTDGFYDTMGVELLKPTKKYLKIVNSFKIALKTV
ncbi:MAG TPA: PilZ domain-containing protein [Nitrospirae bacterium]|nr:PilZ domain-containing protein [Nitrospirota bacterium]